MKRGKNKQQFIMLIYPLFDSEAFSSLSHSALWVFLSILRQRKSTDHGATKENPLICPYVDMLGIKSTASKMKGILELEEKGFIQCDHGGLYKKANRFVLSGEWVNWKYDPVAVPKKRTRPNFKNRSQLQSLKRPTSNIEAD